MKNTLGKTGLAVSPICIGTWQLAGPLALDGRPDLLVGGVRIEEVEIYVQYGPHPTGLYAELREPTG